MWAVQLEQPQEPEREEPEQLLHPQDEHLLQEPQMLEQELQELLEHVIFNPKPPIQWFAPSYSAGGKSVRDFLPGKIKAMGNRTGKAGAGLYRPEEILDERGRGVTRHGRKF